MMLQPNDLPLFCLPTTLSGEAAANLVEFLYALIEALERHYDAPMRRYQRATAGQRDLDFSGPPRDPPF
jgi:hypothetical protein